MFPEKLSQTRRKNNIQNLFTQAHFMVLNIRKHGLSKLSMKMLLKRKTKAEKAYAYRIFLSFKTLVKRRLDNSIRYEVDLYIS